MKRSMQKTGDIAISLAGHDKGKMYVILSVDQDTVWLCDGKYKKKSSPKKKNIKHIQVIKQDNPEWANKVESGKVIDEEIKYFLKTNGGIDV